MAGKMKGFDPKKFFANHGEKLGFGVVLVLVVLGLAGTDWVPYSRTPNEITDKVEQAEQALRSADWQQDAQLEEERAKFVLDESEQPDRVVLARLAGDIQLGPYRPSQKLTKPIVDMDRPLTEPDYLPVEQLIATQARVFIELPPETTDPTATEEGEDAATPAEEAIPEEDLPDELRQRRGAGTGTSIAGYGEIAGEADYGSMYAPELEMEQMYGAMYGMSGEDPSEGGYGMYGMGGAASNRRGRGYPFVSVRGVFPYKNQIYRFQDAIHRSLADAVREFQLIDFELERKELAVGATEWTDWELVDIEVLRDVIRSASGIEPDVVKSSVTDAVITCPLPTRLTGVWDVQATHPRLKNFELSEADLEREMAFNRALLLEFMEEQKQLPATSVTPQGFSDMIFDSRTLQQGLFGAESPYDSAMMTGMYDYEEEMAGMGGYGGGYGGTSGRRNMGPEVSPELEKFAKELAEKFPEDEQAAIGELQAWIVERATAEGELLLYRYLDFDVQPGYSYQYRVRLELKNPNYGKPITAAAGVEHVVQGETRHTPYSDPTEPVRVAETVQYFLAGVEQNKVRPFPDAQMLVYQWDTEIGTVVHDQLTIEMGQDIGGAEKVAQINAAKETYEEADYVFTSDDRLVDAMLDIEFPRGEHPDLALPQGSLGVGHAVEYALVVQDGRALVALDPRTQAAEQRAQEVYIERQEELYSAWKNRGAVGDAEIAGGDYGELYEQLYGSQYGGSGMEDMMEGYGASGRRGRNSLRRGR